MEITKDIRYVGVDDHDIDLFEGQYDVSENGMAYNSYVILGEKIAVADSVDGGFVDEWLRDLPAGVPSGSATSRPCSMAVRPITWSFTIWSPTTLLASSPLWSATPRPRSWPAWAPSA